MLPAALTLSDLTCRYQQQKLAAADNIQRGGGGVTGACRYVCCCSRLKNSSLQLLQHPPIAQPRNTLHATALSSRSLLQQATSKEGGGGDCGLSIFLLLLLHASVLRMLHCSGITTGLFAVLILAG